jgi:hypothetical protein
MNTLKIAGFVILVLFLTTCSKEDVDDQKPEIDMSWLGAFPTNCDTIYIGESFSFMAKFTDNTQLGSYSIDIHHNFDHHSHSTEVTECDLEPKKSAENPLIFINEYEIPENQKEYQANIEISVPAGVDEGDYHFFISLTDREGWRAEKGLSIKLVKK